MHESKKVIQSEKQNSNAYNLLRLIAAFGVLFSHAYILGGYSADPLGILTNNQIDFGSASVITFFAISGSLISQSAIRSNFLDFFWKRFLRIFPLIGLLCFSALSPSALLYGI
jgi:peptidoglycan/LPS O-acetylase OafA/YrhL